MQHLNGDPTIVGQSITLDGRSYTVIGILPRNFRALSGFGLSPDVYLPAFVPNMNFAVFARLKPGMTIAQAKAATQTVAQHIFEKDPDVKHPEAIVEAVAGFARLTDPQAMSIGAFFLVLMTLAGFVLLIACANVASLLLARASTTQREIAVRLSLAQPSDSGSPRFSITPSRR
jgi:hypothetical protein